jgi:hypothetical protein
LVENEEHDRLAFVGDDLNNSEQRMTLRFFVLFLLLAGSLPIAGVWLAGRSLEDHFRFPPAVTPISPGEFSWPIFIAMAIPVAAILLWIGWRVLSVRAYERRTDAALFPWWGWLGIGFGVVSWLLAWNRFEWFAAWQNQTFTPLWLSYVVVINALTYRRLGRCMLTHQPGRLIALFFLSTIVWWYFEHLNRYTGNWFYTGVGDLTPLEYFFQASLPFATVLPAVIGTRDWLATFPRLNAALTYTLPIQPRFPKALAGFAFAISVASLLLLGIWPAQLYPLIWVAPVLLIASLQTLTDRASLFSGVAHGDWRGLLLPALAALQCGLFWEMWNWKSLARWEYSIPWVHEFLIFEMPLLGYAGYLPFGVACAAISELVYSFEYPRRARRAVR